MDSPVLRVTMLGAGQEVGRSCCVLEYRGKVIVCDVGVHPAHSGMASLPFVDELDWSTVDAILVTHFHLDHAAALTYIMEKTNFRDGKGKVYMTHPTKAVHKFMMQDYVRMSSTSSDALFTPADTAMSLASIIAVSTHQLITPCPGVTFTPYHAGHVLGACMFLIDIAGLRILYTGDYSREEDRHLVKAEIPPIQPDVLIVESTFGVHSLDPRDEQEVRFTSLVHSIIRRGGHVLLPAFALGRAQELLLILEEYWKKNPDLHHVTIYYASSLARKVMSVYQTYIHTMNTNIRTRFAKRDNPFIFKHIESIGGTRGWERKLAEGPPCVVLASPGFMDSGPSRELLELWAPDSRNGVIITGYSIEGTMARRIMEEPEEIESAKNPGVKIPRKISVDNISFAAHVDYTQNAEFIELVKAQHVILVHGEATTMGRLKAALTSRYKERDEDVKIHAPRNLETLKLSFRNERVAKAIGALAAKPPQAGDVLSGLLVAKDYSYTLLNPRDLRDFAGLSTCSVTQRQKIAIGVRWDLVRWHLEGMYGSVEEGMDEQGVQTMRVMGSVDLKLTSEHELTLEWESSASNDMIADSTLALITGIDKSPASVKLTNQPHDHGSHGHSHSDKPHPHAETVGLVQSQRICLFLEAHFGRSNVELYFSDDGLEPPVVHIRLDEDQARIDLMSMTVEGDSDIIKKRVEAVLEMAVTTVTPLSQAFVSRIPVDTDEKEKEKEKEQTSPLPSQDTPATLETKPSTTSTPAPLAASGSEGPASSNSDVDAASAAAELESADGSAESMEA